MKESEQYPADKPVFVKYPKIVALASLTEKLPLSPDTIVSVFEKIDGGNCQVRRYNYKLLPGSRGQYLAKRHTEKVDWFRKLCKWMYPNASLYNLPEDITMFGEWSGNHTIQYGPEFSDKFVFLDAFDLKSKRFMEYAKAKALLVEKQIEGLHFLEPLFEGKIKDLNIEKLVMEPSNNYPGPKEGIVIKAYQTPSQEFFKAYYPDFAETRDEKFGKVDHLTTVRFRKAFYGITEETGSMDVSIGRLINTVYQNILGEHNKTYPLSEVKKRLYDYIDSGKLAPIRSHLISENK